MSPDMSESVRNDPNLASVVKAWPDLPEPIRAGIVAMVQTANERAADGDTGRAEKGGP